MNVSKYLTILSACLLCSSCAKQTAEDLSSSQTIHAYCAGNADKTVVVDSGNKVFWEPGDEISVFYLDANLHYLSLSGESSSYTTFASTQSYVFAHTDDGQGPVLLGLYPYDDNALAEDGVITTSLPDLQYARAGSFSSGANITLGKSSDLTMTFYHVNGGLRFSLVNEGIKKVIFEAAGGEKIAGSFKASFNGDYPAVDEVVDGRSQIILVAPEGENFKPGVWYYITALPATLSDGFKMTFETADKIGERTVTNSVSIKRGKFGSVADIDDGVVFHASGLKRDWSVVSGDATAANLIDDDISTAWRAGSASLPASVTIDFGNNLSLNRMTFSQAAPATGTTAAKSIMVEVSTDNVHWQTAAPQTTTVLNSYRQSVDFTDNFYARYARISVLSGVTAGLPVQLAEIDFSGPDYVSGENGRDMPSFVNFSSPFSHSGVDPLHQNPVRWDQLDGWTHENGNRVSCDFGRPVVFVLEPSGADHGAYNVDNAKVFQTLYLLPGTYVFSLYGGEWGASSGTLTIELYVNAARGNTLTDFSVLNSGNPFSDTNNCGYSKVTPKYAMEWSGVWFTIEEPGFYSIGWVYHTSAAFNQWEQYYMTMFHFAQNELI